MKASDKPESPRPFACPYGIILLTRIGTPNGLATINFSNARLATRTSSTISLYAQDGTLMGEVDSADICGFAILEPPQKPILAAPDSRPNEPQEGDL